MKNAAITSTLELYSQRHKCQFGAVSETDSINYASVKILLRSGATLNGLFSSYENDDCIDSIYLDSVPDSATVIFINETAVNISDIVVFKVDGIVVNP